MEVVCVNKRLGVQLHLVGICQHLYGESVSICMVLTAADQGRLAQQ